MQAQAFRKSTRLVEQAADSCSFIGIFRPKSGSFHRVGPYQAFFKRALDLSLSLILLPCCLPLMSLAALLIVTETGGSPLFRQRRVGANGKVFWLLKLRTMYKESDNLSFRTEIGDLRITAIGALLRDLKIDELPQLFHVIIGEMSLIGPRPLSLDETDHLVEGEGFSPLTPGLIPVIRPGMTGLEQCTRSSLTPYPNRFQLNSYYEERVSIWLDLFIAYKTLFVCPVVLFLIAVSIIATAVVISRAYF